jgi:hypothetical protein
MVDQIESIKTHPFRNNVTFLSNFLKITEAAEKSLPLSISEKRLLKKGALEANFCRNNSSVIPRSISHPRETDKGSPPEGYG